MSRSRKRQAKRSKLVTAIICLLMIAGIGVIAYPHILQWLYDGQAHSGYEAFIGHVPNLPPEALPEKIADSDDTNEVPYAELYEQMLAYNEQLYETGQAELSNSRAYERASFTLTEHGFADEIFGYVEIPKINIVLPIYLGASNENMRLGAAHLSETSLPIGGMNTNSVICGHRGYYGAEMFKNLVALEEGDEIRITNPWYVMTYRVTGITTILDDDVDAIKIQPGKDMLSLFTCYQQNGRKDRFVVFCERVQEGVVN